MNIKKKLFLHAPNVHVGGGLALLQALYSTPELSIEFEHVDVRADGKLPPCDGERRFVRPTLFSRLAAELRLWHRVGRQDVVLCFHGLVPLLPVKGEVTVFLQNRILLSGSSLRDYPLKTRIRLSMERLLVRTSSPRVRKFIVQTPSMAMQAKAYLGPKAVVVVCPFVVPVHSIKVSQAHRFDFVYVASAEPHKNHARLLDAWCLLAEQGIRPSLALTVPQDSPLCARIEQLTRKWQLNVVNLGQLSGLEVSALYEQSATLIYPSTTESLGLPLIEAKERGLPIIAAELDYVRDIVDPVETFNPESHVSIARAVRRHLGMAESAQVMHSPAAFLKEVLQ